MEGLAKYDAIIISDVGANTLLLAARCLAPWQDGAEPAEAACATGRRRAAA